MPLTEKGHEIMSGMKKEYGEKKGESVFYASKNAGKISGVDEEADYGDPRKNFEVKGGVVQQKTAECSLPATVSPREMNEANRKFWEKDYGGR